ncbi:MAG: methylated-DNA--[protein]-cysteine S-methyltransferase [Synergistaceae bacterium]|jgi:methylated-DNA-[protein]-cysteine S-methyltransferase|nr:methylated-DNA--[protein]-cysteine S-methyltransferase [Synergistaceae bacterium]
MADYAKVSTPLGEMFLVSEESALCGAWFVGQKYFPSLENWQERENSVLKAAAQELRLYFAGKLRKFSIPAHPVGTAFQQKVWMAIAEIPYQHVSSYGELAAKLGSSPRAVGAATGRNPVSLFIPCHRVVGSDGAITGYAGGLDKKKALLALEGVKVDEDKVVRKH